MFGHWDVVNECSPQGNQQTPRSLPIKTSGEASEEGKIKVIVLTFPS